MARVSRRRLIRQAGALAALGCLSSCAAPTPLAKRIPVVGIFPWIPEANPKTTATFVDRLRELGYEEGRNVTILYRHVTEEQGLDRIAAEFVSLPVDVMDVVGDEAILAAQAATGTIPIVAKVGALDAVDAGLVRSLDRPGGNITGIASSTPTVDAKNIELLREVSPGISRVGVLTDATLPGRTRRKHVLAAGAAFGLEILMLEIRDVSELPGALEKATAEGIGALYLMKPASGVSPATDRALLGYAAARRIPVTYPSVIWVDPALRIAGASPMGGLMSYHVPPFGAESSLAYQGATYVARILDGERPADMAMAQPWEFQITINLKVAREQGIAFPESLLKRANRVIE
jgi:putative ABC transport system substrate-binding protein